MYTLFFVSLNNAQTHKIYPNESSSSSQESILIAGNLSEMQTIVQIMYVITNGCVCIPSGGQLSQAKLKSALQYIVQHYRAESFFWQTFASYCYSFVWGLKFLNWDFWALPVTESLTACVRQIYLTFLDPQRLYWTNSDSWRTATENRLSRFWPRPVAAKHLPNFKQRNSETSSPISWTIGHVMHISQLVVCFSSCTLTRLEATLILRASTFFFF